MLRRGMVAGLMAAGLLAAPALAVPTCPGTDRSTCGGRIIPEASGSAGFLTYDEWTTAMRTLAREHPDRVKFDQIGKTAGGRPLYEVLVTDFAEHAPLSKRTGLYFNGDIHGDERDGTEGFARAIEDLATTRDPTQVDELRREVLVFTDANPDGWQPGDVPPGTGVYKRRNDADHDLNREWPVVGFQNPETFPLTDPEVRSIVQAHGNLLHRKLGVDFAYGFDVHGSAGAETPPNAQLMLDVLLSAGEFDLTRNLDLVQMAEAYMRRLSATTNDNVLATIGGASGSRAYKVGDWATSWDIYGYLVSGGYSDWMANEVTGLGGVAGTIELWLNGEPGQENTFAGFNQEVEASNVHSMRVAVHTVMDLARARGRGVLHLPGPVAYVPNRFALRATPTKPVGDPRTRPPSHPYPVSTNRFFKDLASNSDRPLKSAVARLSRYKAVIVAQDAHTDDPAFMAALKSYAQGGGTVILTDGALKALAGLGIVDASKVAMQKVYAGYFDRTNDSDPLVRGARPLSRQTYEPVPVGYSITNTFSSATSATNAPAWTVDRKAFEAAGGRTAGTTGDGRTSLGEVRLGSGRVRILGALLPDPSGAFEHPFGVADYAVTYWGYQVLANMLDARTALERSRRPAACPSVAGFGSIRARPRRRGVRFRVRRRVRAPFTVDVFRQSRGRRILRLRRVARFAHRTGSFAWSGRGLADGYYVARLAMPLTGGRSDVRRIALRRAHGRLRARRAYQRGAGCGLLRSFRLGRPVFGGRTHRPLAISYRLGSTGRVTLSLLRGRRVVRSFVRPRARAGVTYRLRLPPAGLRRGADYRLRLKATRRSRTAVATLTAHRL